MNVFGLLELIQTPSYKIKTRGEVRTPTLLIDEMLDRIPESRWKQGGLFLDPCCGRGTFLIGIIRRLKKYHSSKNIINMVYGIDIDSWCVYTTKLVISNELKCDIDDVRIGHGNFIEKNFKDMKFNVIAGNPPFKELAKNGRQTGLSIWKNFIVKSMDLLQDDGILAMVHPSGWCAPADGARLNENIFSRYNLVYANISDTVGNHFRGVGSTFSYTVTVKEPYKHNTTITTNNGDYCIDLTKTKLITNTGLSIILKLVNNNYPRVVFKRPGNNLRYPGIGYTNLNKIPSAVHINIHHVNSGIDYLEGTKIPVRWSEEPSPLRNKRKIVIPYNGPPNIIVDDGQYGVGMCPTYLLPEISTIDGATSVFHSKLFKFYAKLQKFTGYNESPNLSQFPLIDLTRVWTDDELFKHFDLSQMEIDLINSTIK